jgi:hypothetical protein
MIFCSPLLLSVLRKENYWTMRTENPVKPHETMSSVFLIINSNIISRLAGQFVTGCVSISDTILLIPQVLYEHGNHGGMISTELLIHPPELSGNPASIYPVANQDELGERNYEFSLRSFLLIFRSGLSHAVKSHYMWPPAIIYLREKTCCALLSPLKSIA